MIRPISHIRSHLNDALWPTLLALLWCTILVYLKRLSLASSHTHDPPPYTSSPPFDLSRAWKDLEYASQRIIASLSTVTGLLLAFRSNSAIDRWSTARRKWSDVQATSRSLLRLLAASLLSRSKTAGDESLEGFAKHQSEQARVEGLLATVPFFSISLMYEMRGRAPELKRGGKSLLRQDLVDVLPPHLIAATHRKHDTNPMELGEEKKIEQTQNVDSPHVIRPLTRTHHAADGSTISTNLALTSLVTLQRSLDAFHASSALAAPVYAHCIGLFNSLTSHMTELERIRDTPIPPSVSSHFSRLLAIHTALLPIIVVQRLGEGSGWLCGVVVGVVTSMLYGVDSFASRLGEPMGLDREDLPLERYVAEAQREWDEIRSACG